MKGSSNLKVTYLVMEGYDYANFVTTVLITFLVVKITYSQKAYSRKEANQELLAAKLQVHYLQ